MRPFTTTIDFEEALRRVLAAATPLTRAERVRIEQADGRVAAADVLSPLDVPPFDRAAMDGYAVIAADTIGASPASPAVLDCVSQIFTGDVPTLALQPRSCIEIATGAPLPDGADAVVMVEQTERHERAVRVLAEVSPGQHIGRRGADIVSGQCAIAEGQVLTPARVGVLAAIGAPDVMVVARPSVAVLSTGNELAAQGRPLRRGQVYDINGHTLSALVARHGGHAVRQAPAADTVADLAAALTAAAEHDVIVFSGGSSVGERDLVLDAVRAAGEVIFHGIAVRPGKPTLFAHVGRALVFGMPGYPTSCLSNGYMLLVPLVRALARLPPWVPRSETLPLAARVMSIVGRRQFYTVRVRNGRAEPAFKASGDITSMAAADGYIEIPAGSGAIEAGTAVTVTFF